MTNETTYDTWFAHASLNSQFGYILACAIADREQSVRFWRTEAESEYGSPSSVTLAADANACLTIMRQIQDSLAKGEIVIDRIIPNDRSEEITERRSWDARQDMG